MKLAGLDLLYMSGDMDQIAKGVVMRVLQTVPNNDGREILEVEAPHLRQHLGHDRYLVTDISRSMSISSNVRHSVVPVYLLQWRLQSGGNVDVHNLKPQILDRGTVSLL